MLNVVRDYWIQWGLGIIASALVLIYGHLSHRIRAANQENLALKNGIRAILRDRIVQAYEYHMNKGCWPIHSREAVMGMFEQYRILGGNGVVTHLLEELGELPTEIRDADAPERKR